MSEIAKNTRMAKRAQARQQLDLSRFIMQDKENLGMYTDNNEEPVQRSPLPVGYPRLPLQDITDVLSPLNRMNDFDDEQGGKKKPKPKARKKVVTRSCQMLVEDGPSTSSQDPAAQDPTSHPDAETAATEGALTSPTNPKSCVVTRSKKSVRFAATEESTKVDLCAEGSSEVNTAVQRSAPEAGPNPPSPNSPRVKRRKPPAKSTAGKNVARFR